MADIRRMFMEYDKDGNGVVSLDEAHDILEKELAFTTEQSVELMKRYDKNGDGELSYEEFVKFYSKVKAK
jgi:Ca2+-binding EF-hand superfamily protein